MTLRKNNNPPSLDLAKFEDEVTAAEITVKLEEAPPPPPQPLPSQFANPGLLQRVTTWRARMARRSPAPKPKRIVRTETKLMCAMEQAWLALQEHEGKHGLSRDGNARLRFIIEQTEVDTD